MYNLISFLGLAIMLTLGYLFYKTEKEEQIYRILSIIIFVYKLAYYVIINIKGQFSVPIEISTITYFLMAVILMFKIKKLYVVGSFFGILAGIGYFVFYLCAGFTLQNSFLLKDVILGCFSHGYLLISGIYLFRNNDFKKSELPKLWITIFAMLCWALVFYDMGVQGITFIYYIIKPMFLLTSITSLNIIILISYYVILAVLFRLVIELFFWSNERVKVHKKIQP